MIAHPGGDLIMQHKFPYDLHTYTFSYKYRINKIRSTLFESTHKARSMENKYIVQTNDGRNDCF